VTRFRSKDGWWPKGPSQPISEEEIQQLDKVNDEAAAKIRRDYESGKNSLSLSKETLPEPSQHRPTQRMPRLLQVILFVGLSGLGLLGIRILPATASEGWIHFIALLAALGLIVAALREVTRNK
jgi:hypothetical protein